MTFWKLLRFSDFIITVPIFCGKWYRGEGKTFKINNVEMQDRHSCKRRLGCLFCLYRRRVWQGGADVSGRKWVHEFMSANVFLIPCVSYLLGSKGNMPTGLPGVFTVFRLGVYKTQIPGGYKNHILRLDHSREADLCNLLLKLRPKCFHLFCQRKENSLNSNQISELLSHRFWLDLSYHAIKGDEYTYSIKYTQPWKK